MTYDEIKTGAFAYVSREESNPKGCSDIESFILKGNDVFFSSFSDLQKRHFIDNLLLDYYTMGVAYDSWEYNAEQINKVHEAAKLIYARHLGEASVMIRDLEGASDIFGSPWSCHCPTVSDWVIAFAALRMENDECCISGPITSEMVADGVQLVRDLQATGISNERIEESLGTLFYNRYPLMNSVSYFFGMQQYIPSESDIEEEAEAAQTLETFLNVA